MTNATVYQPIGGGLRQDKQVPAKVQRRALSRPVYKRRLCRDNRAYVAVPFTITGTIATGDYGPMWRVDRDYWVAKVIMNVGRHDTDTHPDDGTPSGAAIVANMRRVSVDLSTDVAILASDTRLHIAVDHHQDAINNSEDGGFVEGDFNINRLNEGQHVYPRISQVGSSRPGNNLVVTIVLVPIP